MISKLRTLNDDTVVAEGPMFDLEKVLETAMMTLRALVRWCAMKFPDADPPTIHHVHERDLRPYEDGSCDEIAAVFRRAKAQSYDVTDFHYMVAFGPFAAHLHLLGFEALHGPQNNCETTFGLNWEDLDPTPIILIRVREGAEIPIGERDREFLERMLGNLEGRKGVELEGWILSGMHFYGIRFPYADFGAGDGRIRICRYLDDDEAEEGDGT